MTTKRPPRPRVDDSKASRTRPAAVQGLVKALRMIERWDPAAAPAEPNGMSIIDAQDIARAALQAWQQVSELPICPTHNLPCFKGGQYRDWTCPACELERLWFWMEKEEAEQ